MLPALDMAYIRSYLLGALSEPEEMALEERYFADPEAFEQVWAAEYELVDDYAAGRLDAADRDLFERNFLGSPRHRERVAAARALRRMSGEREANAPPFVGVVSKESVRHPSRALGWWIALAAAVVAAAAGWLLRPGRSEPTVALGPPGPPPVSASPSPSASLVPGPVGADVRSPLVASFALSPILLRGGKEQPRLRIPPDTDEVVLNLQGVPATSSRLTFVLRTVEGTVIASGRAERLGAPSIASARVPADRLSADDYILILSAPGDDEPLHQYFFRVFER